MHQDRQPHPTDVVEWAKALAAAPLSETVATELIELAGRAEPDRAQMAAWALGVGEIPRHIRSVAVRALLDVVVDATRPGAVRGQAAEAAAQQLAFSDHLDPDRMETESCLIDMLDDPKASVRFWCAFGLATLRSTAAVPRLRELMADTTLVPGWWTVGQEAADAIDISEGRLAPERVGRKTNHPEMPPPGGPAT